MATLADVISSNWSLSLTNQDEIVQGIDDIRQCVYIILTTVKGSDPLRPDFGCGIHTKIDLPVTQLATEGKKDILEALQTYEPRITVTNIKATVELSTVTFDVVWKLVNSTAAENTRLTITT